MKPHGIHIILDLLECEDNEYLTDAEKSRDFFIHIIKKSGLTIIRDIFHSFGAGPEGQYGYTGIVMLAESHVSAHTWKAERKVNIDIFCCNVTRDNTNAAWEIATQIENLYNPKKTIKQNLERA